MVEYVPVVEKELLAQRYFNLLEKADSALKEQRITKEEWERLCKVYRSVYEELHNKGIEILEI